jgi:hypothetical protein
VLLMGTGALLDERMSVRDMLIIVCFLPLETCFFAINQCQMRLFSAFRRAQRRFLCAFLRLMTCFFNEMCQGLAIKVYIFIFKYTRESLTSSSKSEICALIFLT